MSFGSEFPDGRLCAEPSGKLYRLREAIEMSKRLGGPLIDKEYEEFRIKKIIQKKSRAIILIVALF